MDIKVSLPKPSDTTGQEIKHFLRQLELSVHHLQKTVEENEGYVKVHVDDVRRVIVIPKENIIK